MDFDVARGEATWSREMYRIYGEDPETFVPTRGALAERIVDEDRGPITEQIRAAIDRGGEFDAFARLRRPDGEIRDVRFRGAMVGVPGSTSGHLLGICQDITDIRRAEAARAEAVERFRSVFERAPIGMALMTRDGRFALANEAMAAFLGRTADALLDCTVADVTHPDDLPASGEALRRMIAGELAEWNTEKRYVRPTGEVRWGALRVLLLHDADGEARTVLSLIRDITEQRLAERRRAALHGVARIMAGGRRWATRSPRSSARWYASSSGSAGACGCSTRRASCSTRPRRRSAARRRTHRSCPRRRWPGTGASRSRWPAAPACSACSSSPARARCASTTTSRSSPRRWARRSPSTWSASGPRSCCSTRRCTTR